MGKARRLYKRLRAVRNIRTITRTMEMIAVARFKRIHDRAVLARRVAERLEEIFSDVVASVGPGHALLRAGGGRQVALVVLTSNRGLCGGYNHRMMEAARSSLAAVAQQGLQPRLTMVGKKGLARMRFKAFPKPRRVLNQFDDAERLSDQVGQMAAELRDEFLGGQLHSVQVVYQKMHTPSAFRPETATLLPLEVRTGGTGVSPVFDGPQARRLYYQKQYEFMPSPQAVLDELAPLALRARLMQFFLDALVSEQIARMASMRSATSNADEMVKTLTRRINRVRQGQITNELSEIMGGAEALK